MTTLAGWKLSRHAIERALDMAVDGEEIREVLENPTRETPSSKYPGYVNLSNGRITLGVNPEQKVVVTVLWDVHDDTGAVITARYDRENLRDKMSRIRDRKKPT